METTKKIGTRMLWVDWMKIGATLAIIWGHFFSPGDVFLYVFSVQSFCVISGFLYKRSPDWWSCLRSAFWNLLVPTVIMSMVMQLDRYVRGLVLGEPYDLGLWFFKLTLLGDRWCMGPCWYFYSLMVIRLIMQLLPEKRWVYALLLAALSSVAIYLNHIGFVASNAIVNVVVCMPCFLLGVFLKPLKQWLDSNRSVVLNTALLAVSVALVVVCGIYNDYAWMYLNAYGNYYLLFLAGGMAGTSMLYAAAMLLIRLPWRETVVRLSMGTMPIIGLHIIIVRRLTDLPNRMWGEDLLFAVLILLAFVPVLKALELYFPLLLGRYKKK